MLAFLVLASIATFAAFAVPLPVRLVDMTHPFDESTQQWPGLREFKLEISRNGTTDLGIWMQTGEYSSGIHVGTHIDAPSDVIRGGRTIDEIPLSSFLAPASVVDITTRAESNPNAEVTVQDLLDWESTTGQSLNGTVLLLRSGWGRKWNNRTAYFGLQDDSTSTLHFPGLAGNAANWLVANRKIVGIGTETLSYDVGTSEEFPAHLALLGDDIYGLENVANMDQLPIYGATLQVMPMKIGRATGAPVRIIASFPIIIHNSHSLDNS